jgi:hypothetical protein
MRWILCFLAAGLTAAEVTVEQVNKALGLELFADASLWDDDAKAVADRLAWPQESETTNDASYRLYPKDDYRVLGSRPYSCSFLAEQAKPSSLSLMFANKGDSVSIDSKAAKDKDKAKERDSQIKDFKKAIADDSKSLGEKLTALFGKPVGDRMGQGRTTSEVVRRWDWNGHAFLLAAPKDEYVALRILSVKSADEGGRSRVTDAELFARAKTRVDRRPNGDVILKDIPMVNQGPKGYCVRPPGSASCAIWACRRTCMSWPWLARAVPAGVPRFKGSPTVPMLPCAAVAERLRPRASRSIPLRSPSTLIVVSRLCG